MTDNEKKAHDLAMLLVQNEISNGEIAEVQKKEKAQVTLGFYKSAYAKFLVDFQKDD